MAERPRILIVDDEPSVRASLDIALELEGCDVLAVDGGAAALEAAAAGEVDAIVLDVAMPDPDGLEVCRRLRARGDGTPIIMLTARDSVGDRVEGLEAGADDYLVKPFALRELVARVRALLRRAGPSGGPRALSYDDLSLDSATHRATRGARVLTLTRTEFLLLELFLRHPEEVLTRTRIHEEVWGYDFGTDSNSLGVFVGYLRRKLESGGEPRLLHTVRSVGYVLRREP